eukprot:COSAG02_NODE_726_length_18005_cov_69.224897_6_plen_105_part_00
MLVDDGEEAEISVRAWRWSYNGASVSNVWFACDYSVEHRESSQGAHPFAACVWHSAGHSRAPKPAQGGTDCSRCGSSMVNSSPPICDAQAVSAFQLRRWIERDR